MPAMAIESRKESRRIKEEEEILEVRSMGSILWRRDHEEVFSSISIKREEVKRA